ncbi:MAG TPA: ATP-binding cassette domain-containing protein, partial [Syntrophobacteraceae bacterium]|nr:ATP-binding cassette domain-containing protein [Syntrophobacteraceae bacterium]
MLRVNDLQVYYGGIHALRGISLRAPEGRIVTLIGANGAGKTTTLRAVTGLVKPRSGSVRLGGEELTRLDPFRIIRKGIGVSPEGRRVFPNLTVLENLELGAYYRTSREISAELERVYSLFPR